jgi:chorismate dehydratase
VPSIELFRKPEYRIVSDACVACRGPVLSVKLHFRVPPAKVRTVALDEGSRTSSALTRILLAEIGATPRYERLPIGSGLDEATADAVLLIGDRAMLPVEEAFCDVWDLGQKWTDWTGLPFVFAMWIAREGVDTSEIAPLLSAARDEGLAHLDEIAAAEAPALGVPADVAAGYLRDNLHFTLGPAECEGRSRFFDLCARHRRRAELAR